MVTISLARTLASRSESELVDLHDRWGGGKPPVRRPDLVQALKERMVEPITVSNLCGGLYGALAPVFRLLSEVDGGLGLDAIRKAARKEGVAERSVRVALSELVSLGLVAEVGVGHNGSTVGHWGVPQELRAVVPTASLPEAVMRSPLSLRGWVHAYFRSKGMAGGEAVRRMYLLLASEQAILARFQDLDEDFRSLLESFASEWGGILPIEEFEQLESPWSLEEVVERLEEASLGSRAHLNLEPSGVRQNGEVLCLFHEVVLALLRSKCGQIQPQADEIASIGVDFVSNFSRFASFVEGDTVRFTVRGTIFKSTGKRIADQLLPNPGREFRRFEILELEYRFALACRFIDRTGRRSFRLTPSGQEFLASSLLEKQRMMLDWLIEDRQLPGDLAHQLRLRRTTLRYIKRLEPEVWHDAMFLPFVVRNHHLAGLTSQEESAQPNAGSFPVRSSADLRSLAWNLFVWVRKYLYLLGIVDMAYDESGRAVAFRLTRMGAELLDMIPGREIEGSGHVVVNPDFEVVLFPDLRSHELIYSLDRFCDREFTDSLYHYRISPASLHRGLSEGVTLDEVLELLTSRSRTPLPQNVTYSLRSWARKDGLIVLEPGHRLSCELKEVLDRILLHPGLTGLGAERIDDQTIQLAEEPDFDQLSAWIRDYGASLTRPA